MTTQSEVPTTAQLVERIPGYDKLAATLPTPDDPLGCYAALAAYRGATIPQPPPLPTGGTVRMWQDSAFASERIAQEQRARAERAETALATLDGYVARIIFLEMLRRGWRKRAKAAPPPDLFPSIRQDIDKTHQQFIRAAKALNMGDLCAAGPIYEQAKTVVDTLILRSQVVRDQKSELDYLKQLLAHDTAAPHAGQTGSDPSITHAPAESGAG